MDNAERHGTAPFVASLGCDGSDILIAISDHGQGVDAALLDRLGQPFLRGDRARTSTGSGLGLSIVKRAVELHEGTLQLRNNEAGGFAATIRLPACHLTA